MGLNDNRAMAARLSAFVIWALVAAGAVFWGYRFWASATPLPANVQVVSAGTSPRADLTRLLGAAPVVAGPAEPAPVAESSRVRLVGVLAPKPAGAASGAGSKAGAGVALIAIDGKAPRAYVVGTRVDGDLLLTAVSHRSASLGAAPGAPGMVLELPPLPPPSTGTLARAVPGVDAGRAAAPGAMIPNPGAAANGALQARGAAPGGGPRSPAQQAAAAQAQGGDDESDDEDEPPAPPSAPRPRPGSPMTR